VFKRKNIRHLQRYHQIINILVKHGLGYLVQRLGWEEITPSSCRSEVCSCEREGDEILAVRLRLALTELGPTFVKLGQMLSTRPDLLPPVFICELEELQDKVSALDEEQIIRQLEHDLGHPDQIFAYFDRQPLAAASIGQVHRARLKSGEEVVVKVQRPGLEVTMQNDLEIIRGLAELSERRSPEIRRIGLAAMIDDYSRMLIRELDYEREARSTDRARANFADDDRVVIPKIFWEYSTRRVLTQEYIEGVKLSNMEEISRRGWDRRKLSLLGTETFLSQIVLHGFFQADPHPGNILVLDEDRIAFIDFGEVGTLTESRLVQLGELLLSVSRRDIDKAVATLEDMEIIGDFVDREGLEEDLADLVGHVTSSSVGELDMNRLRVEVMDVAYRHDLRMPSYLTALMKALVTVEGVGKKLDPTFNFMDIAQPLAIRVFEERLKPDKVYRHLRRKYYRDIKPLGTLPADFQKLVKTAGQGQLQVTMQVEFSSSSKRQMNQLASRLGISLIISAGLISSALVMTAGRGMGDTITLVGVGGFAAALIGLAVFILSVLRS
jgi:ubiquinone biosynthesis protein